MRAAWIFVGCTNPLLVIPSRTSGGSPRSAKVFEVSKVSSASGISVGEASGGVFGVSMGGLRAGRFGKEVATNFIFAVLDRRGSSEGG